uniref:Uncharacterized protein n=1 Tax=Oryza brachyantha TaxID=4533 RepID=J3LZ45_ORYBR
MAVLLRPAAIAGGRQVWPVAEDHHQQLLDEAEAEAASQRLVEAVARGDAREAGELLASGRADVNYAGVVWLKARRVAEAALRGGAAADMRETHEEIRADVSPLFLAAGNGDAALVRALLVKGADVNGKVFRGYPATAAAREGRALQGQATLAAIFMGSDLVRPRVAVHALVSAAARGFVDVVDSLIKCGADPNATSRVLLRSLKPSLHANVDCTALFAAIVSRQVAVVRQLLQAGVRRDTKVRLGAWSWDTATGEELRVGAGLADPYDAVWCAVEYYESTGSILRMLLQNGYSSGGATHLGRTLLHHAVLCGSAGAVQTLLASGVDHEAPVKTSRSSRSRPVHMAARLGQPEILEMLIAKGCDVNARAEGGDVAAILAARHKREDCLRVLVSAGADVALLNSAGESAPSVACSGGWKGGFESIVLGVIRSGMIPRSSDRNVFSPMMFAARCGDSAAMEVLLAQPDVDVDEQDVDGCSPIIAAAKEGNVDAFRALVFAGANVKLSNKRGETAIGLAQQSKKRDLFEQVMLEFVLEKGIPGGFYALHCASRRGDTAAVRHLASTGCDVNIPDGDGYTPLMLAAREGHASVCELLISYGARCDIRTPRGETALSLARAALATAAFNKAEDVIMDELGRRLVVEGAHVKKHTKCGRGKPHGKPLRMVAAAGVLRWGGSARRNVVCREAEVGGSSAFQLHRQRRGCDAYEPGLFRVVTATGREVHFVCQGGEEAAELWVRGIRAVTRAVYGKRGKE